MLTWKDEMDLESGKLGVLFDKSSAVLLKAGVDERSMEDSCGWSKPDLSCKVFLDC